VLFRSIGVSVLLNSLFFNFYYLPTLNEYNTRIQVSSSQNTRQTGDEKQDKPNYFLKKNYDHIAFPSLTDEGNQQAHSIQQQQEYSLINSESLNNLIEENLHSTSLEQIEAENQKNLIKKQHEAKMALNLALNMQKAGKFEKAAKIYKYALSLDPQNTDTLVSYGEYLELYKKDIIKAEHLYTKVLAMKPTHNKASLNLKRALPVVNKLDRLMLDKLDALLTKFYEIPSTNAALKRAKREAYFMHIYHSNAIEGNTLNLQQTRHIIENRMAINGKSLIEHQEVLGLDAAMRFINETLLYRQFDFVNKQEILEIHRRVLGFCDPIESGRFRKHQVYVGNFVPPAAHLVEGLIDEFIEWLNSNQVFTEVHPVQIAALAHYKFVYIHPFYDGNGRTARILMNLILMKSGYPPVIIKKEERLDYYEYLEMANQGDVKPFIRFIVRCTKRTLEEYINICDDSYGISVDNETKMIRSELMLNYNLNQFDEEYMNKLDGLSADESLQCDEVVTKDHDGVLNSELTNSLTDSKS